MVQTHRELLLSVGLLVRMVQMQREILCTLRKVGTSDVGRYKASCEHWNNPLVTTSKYYGWYY